jgi:hypothetical protein
MRLGGEEANETEERWVVISFLLRRGSPLYLVQRVDAMLTAPCLCTYIQISLVHVMNYPNVMMGAVLSGALCTKKGILQ